MVKILLYHTLSERYSVELRKRMPDIELYVARDLKETENLPLSQIDIIFAWKFPSELLTKMPGLKWIQLTSVGADHVLNIPDLPSNISICTTRGIHAPQMSELAIGLMVALGRGLHQIIKNQQKELWKEWIGVDLAGKTALIIGTGSIGKEIARKAKCFDMQTIGIKNSKEPVIYFDEVYSQQELNLMLPRADFILLVVPLTNKTRKLIGEEQLKLIKSTAFIINLARGEVIDQPALIKALKNKNISAAALDVFEEEPLPKNHPLWKLENVIITPHIAGAHKDYVDRTLNIFQENLGLWKAGKPLVNVVDRKKMY